MFGRYSPSKEDRELLERAHSAKFKYIKNPMQVEVELSFDRHEQAEQLYRIEDECRELYGASVFKILPHFPKDPGFLHRLRHALRPNSKSEAPL